MTGPEAGSGRESGGPVPGSPAEITATWLDAALRNSGSGTGVSSAGVSSAGGVGGPAMELEVGSIEVEPLGPSVGLLGDLARVRVEYRRGTGPATVIVKLPTAEPGGHQVGSMLRAWAREVAFYREVAPASPGARLPRCYHTGADPANGRWVVVLEDCPHDPVDSMAGATQQQAEAAVDALAGFHATWWQSDRTFPWMPGFDTTGVGGLQGPWLDAIPIFIERYGHLIPDQTAEWLQAFAPRLAHWSDRAAVEPLTIVHADYRLDNLLPYGGRITMIDWQTALRGPGAMDLTCFIVTSLPVNDRRASEPALIERYIDGLAAAGVTVDRAWFQRSYGENLLWWMGQFANNLARLHPEDEATQLALDTMIERTYTAALDHDVGRLLVTD